ncbi:MAG: hypothetical protein LBB21_02335 [Holosporaceae bacterium]|jgi:hypothetical protein|nr:hypothetical protein [Holosporaceae bacterium]
MLFDGNMRGVSCGVCCAAAVICGVMVVEDVNSMEMPTIAYSQNEGPNLAAYH